MLDSLGIGDLPSELVWHLMGLALSCLPGKPIGILITGVSRMGGDPKDRHLVVSARDVGADPDCRPGPLLA